MKDAFKIAWLFYSSIILIIITAVLFLPGEIYLDKTPLCTFKSQTGMDCFACGFSHGFREITQGNIDKAGEFNKASLPVFSVFLLNTLLFIYYLKVKLINRKGNKT